MERKTARAPLQDVKNLQSDNRKSLLPVRKPGVNRKSLIAKNSSLPKPPRAARLTTTRTQNENSNNDLPAPSRMSAKPKRTANTSNRFNSRMSMTTDPSRRSTTAINFTRRNVPTRTGITGRRAVHADDPHASQGNLNSALASQGFDFSAALASSFQEFLKDVKSRTDETSRSNVELIDEMVKKHLGSMSEEKANNIAEETLKLKSDILDLHMKLSEARQEATKWENTAGSLGINISEMQATMNALEESNKAAVGFSQEEVNTLQKQLTESERQGKELADVVERLERQLTSKCEVLEEQEKAAAQLSADLKGTMERVEMIKTNLSCRESEIRRLKREKEEIESEREETADTLRKRSTSLQEERGVTEDLRAQVERLRREGEREVREAEVKLQQYREEMDSRMALTEKERDELQTAKTRTKNDLDNRCKELEALKEAISLQETKLSQLNCEKISHDLRINALNENIAKSLQETAQLSGIIEKKSVEISVLEQQAREDATTRRQLHNTIQELKGNIRVYARVRPLLSHELKVDDADSAQAKQMFDFTERGQGLTAVNPTFEERSGIGEMKRPRYPFKFDRVFDPTSTQESVFEEISQLVQSALDGYRVCIFAYGQTGSGKTHTMVGENGNDGSRLGMIPRSVRQIFETAKAMEKDEWSFKIKASFMEIYNEVIRDLLGESGVLVKQKTRDVKGKDDQYKIHFNAQTNLTTISDMTVEEVTSEEQLHRLIDRSMKRRATAATKANERSSRSHSVFRLYIEGANAQTGQKLTGLLNLIDLAGSERLSQSKAEGDRLRETRNINKSLSALGDVISSLANKDRHIPFRNSKLTHLLQDSLGGESKTLMFVNVSHAPESFHESLTSLRFASKVNSCHVGTAKRSARIEL